MADVSCFKVREAVFACFTYLASNMASLGSLLPMGIMTDSYKASHYLQYPACRKMVAVCTRYGLHCIPFGVQKKETSYVYCVISDKSMACSMENFAVAS